MEFMIAAFARGRDRVARTFDGDDLPMLPWEQIQAAGPSPHNCRE